MLFNNSLAGLDDYRNWWRPIVRLLFLILVAKVSRVIAEPLDKYCLSPVERKTETRLTLSPNKTARVTIPTRGQSLEVVVSGIDTLLLKRSGIPTPLLSVRAPQYDYGQIEALVSTQDGWLWIDGGQIDYMARLDLNANPPTLSPPKALPELYERPCSFWHRFWGNCIIAQGVYSQALDRVFITGHRATFWGRSSLTTFEIIAGEGKEMGSIARGASLVYPVYDVPRLRGILLRGIKDELFFYDGITVTTILSGESARSRNGITEWYIHSTDSGRTFVTNAGRFRDPFLKEIKPGPLTIEISVPKTLAGSWLSLFQKVDKEPLWGITRQSLFVEIQGTLKPVATVREGAFLEGPAGIEQSSDGSITFTVKDKTTDRSTDYRLARSSVTGPCGIRLNARRPISLTP
ncbi:MAG: hypothetical protein RPG89_01190 [Microcystis panniformis WG22]|nr:hypothetical protein [Microcystis panniformis WG22]